MAMGALLSCGGGGACHPVLGPCCLMPSMLSTCVSEQTYCDRLVQDTPFLMGHGRLSEQQVDRIILQLNRYYPQILSNKDAEKVLSEGHACQMLLSYSFLSGLGEREAGELRDANCLFGVSLGPEH